MEKHDTILYKTIVYICAAITVAWILAEFINLYKPTNDNDRIKIIEEKTNEETHHNGDTHRGRSKYRGKTMDQDERVAPYVPNLDGRHGRRMQDGSLPTVVRPPKYLQAGLVGG